MMRRTILTILLTAFLGQLHPQSGAKPIEFVLGGKRLVIGGNAGFGIEPVRGEKDLWRLSLGATDRATRQEFIVNLEIKSKGWPKSFYSDLRYNHVTVIYKNGTGESFTLMPAVLFARGKSTKEKKQEWLKMSKEKRIREGKGVRLNKKMEGSLFSIEGQILYDSKGRPMRIIGTFSGILAAPASPTGRPASLKNGKFDLGVMQ